MKESGRMGGRDGGETGGGPVVLAAETQPWQVEDEKQD